MPKKTAAPAAPARFTKISATGKELAATSSKFVAVRDNTTGLTWSRGNVTKKRVKQAEAVQACAKLKLAGSSDWRLPTIRELLTLVDYERHNPAIDTDFFQCDPSWYWTSTAWAPSPGDYAWDVYFSNGNADAYHRDYDGFVRAVRASQ